MHYLNCLIQIKDQIKIRLSDDNESGFKSNFKLVLQTLYYNIKVIEKVRKTDSIEQMAD